MEDFDSDSSTGETLEAYPLAFAAKLLAPVARQGATAAANAAVGSATRSAKRPSAGNKQKKPRAGAALVNAMNQATLEDRPRAQTQRESPRPKGERRLAENSSVRLGPGSVITLATDATLVRGSGLDFALRGSELILRAVPSNFVGTPLRRNNLQAMPVIIDTGAAKTLLPVRSRNWVLNHQEGHTRFIGGQQPVASIDAHTLAIPDDLGVAIIGRSWLLGHSGPTFDTAAGCNLIGKNSVPFGTEVANLETHLTVNDLDVQEVALLGDKAFAVVPGNLPAVHASYYNLFHRGNHIAQDYDPGSPRYAPCIDRLEHDATATLGDQRIHLQAFPLTWECCASPAMVSTPTGFLYVSDGNDTPTQQQVNIGDPQITVVWANAGASMPFGVCGADKQCYVCGAGMNSIEVNINGKFCTIIGATDSDVRYAIRAGCFERYVTSEPDYMTSEKATELAEQLNLTLGYPPSRAIHTPSARLRLNVQAFAEYDAREDIQRRIENELGSIADPALAKRAVELAQMVLDPGHAPSHSPPPLTAGSAFQISTQTGVELSANAYNGSTYALGVMALPHLRSHLLTTVYTIPSAAGVVTLARYKVDGATGDWGPSTDFANRIYPAVAPARYFSIPAAGTVYVQIPFGGGVSDNANYAIFPSTLRSGINRLTTATYTNITPKTYGSTLIPLGFSCQQGSRSGLFCRLVVRTLVPLAGAETVTFNLMSLQWDGSSWSETTSGSWEAGVVTGATKTGQISTFGLWAAPSAGRVVAGVALRAVSTAAATCSFTLEDITLEYIDDGGSAGTTANAPFSRWTVSAATASGTISTAAQPTTQYAFTGLSMLVSNKAPDAYVIGDCFAASLPPGDPSVLCGMDPQFVLSIEGSHSGHVRKGAYLVGATSATQMRGRRVSTSSTSDLDNCSCVFLYEATVSGSAIAAQVRASLSASITCYSLLNIMNPTGVDNDSTLLDIMSSLHTPRPLVCENETHFKMVRRQFLAALRRLPYSARVAAAAKVTNLLESATIRQSGQRSQREATSSRRR